MTNKKRNKVFEEIDNVKDQKLFTSKMYLIGCLIVCIVAIFALFEDDASGCADDGGVWDEEFRICRFDCHHWNPKDGCILISDEELEKFVNGYCEGEGKGLYRCEQSRLELSKRKLHDEMNKNNKEK